MIGAVEPDKGKHFGFCYTILNTSVMNEFLRLLSRQVGSLKHIVLVVDNAGWHDSAELEVPTNITLLPLPPYSPELNPIENLWGYLKENFLSGRVFKDEEAVIQAGCEVLRNLTPEEVRSVCHRDWVSAISSN
jgi:transposase